MSTLLLLTLIAADLLPWSAPESMDRLARSKQKVDFVRLTNQFESQQNIGYCGPATAVIVLNTLRIDNTAASKPRDESLFPAEYRKRLPPGMDPVFKRYTQGLFFDDKTTSVKTRDQFFGTPKTPGDKPSPGIELRELHEVLKAHGLASELRVADDKLTDETIRAEITRNLATPDDYVVINFFRPVLGQKGGGHMSPLGAYDQSSDSVLLLDVNPNGHTWAWVPMDTLIKAMRTRDVHENRGYLLVKEGTR
jgi:hypothetical protein